MSGFLAFLRLELSDALRSKWAAFTALLYVALGLAFVWLGLHESTVLGFTGLSRVLLNLTSTVILVCPLVVLIGTHAAVVKARTTGFCELLLAQPVKRSTWFAALLASRLILLVGPLFALWLAVSLASPFMQDDAALASVAARSLGICVSLVFSFVGIGLFVSAAASTVERAMVWALTVFVITSALHDVLLITALLRTPLPPSLVFALSALNPNEVARIGILTSVDPELSALGPVGFWLANRLGPGLALALALVWPALVGVAGALAARWKIRRLDLVA